MKLKRKPIQKLRVKKKVGVQKEQNYGTGYTGEWRYILDDVAFPYKPEKKTCTVIDNVGSLKKLARRMMVIPAFAYDTETNTLDACADSDFFKCADITISWGEDENYDILVNKLREEDIDRNIDLSDIVQYLGPVFEREDVLIVGHNLKFDLHVMRRLGIVVRTKKLFDTMLAAWLCDENTPNGLKECSNRLM